jgi:hypothetical protein
MLLKRFLLYGMPLYIVLAELSLRSLLANVPGRAEDVSPYLIGPTIAVAGLSLILPTLSPKLVPLPPGAPTNVIAINNSDQKLTEWGLIAVFVLFFLWAYSIYLNHPNPPSIWSLIIGLFTYTIGVVFTELKERI